MIWEVYPRIAFHKIINKVKSKIEFRIVDSANHRDVFQAVYFYSAVL